MEYTKGEWTVIQDEASALTIISGTKYVAKTSKAISRQDHLEVQDNARLIAAAPQMYEALKALVPIIESFTPYQRKRPEVLRAIEALAKAEGKQG